jgi:Myb/SANT-like DNA-binding domain
MIHTLLAELLEQVHKGKKAGSGFKAEAWEAVLKQVTLVSGGQLVTTNKLKQKEQTYKGLFKDWKFLRDQSGFGWDEALQMITASDQAWEDIIAVSTLLN